MSGNSDTTTMMVQQQPTVLDLFCGCGGMSTGLLKAGFNVVVAVDIWNKATETYKANHPETKVITQDISTIDPSTLLDGTNVNNIDVIVGGPPCQGFSMAGRRVAGDPRNSLFVHFIRMVNHFKPKYVIMENVQGILTMKTEDGTLVKDIILEEYKRIGYNVTHYTLNAADYQVPQARKRVFFLGRRNDDENTPPLPVFTAPQKVNPTNHIAVGTVLLPRDNVPETAYLSERALEGIRRKREASKSKGHGFGAQILDLNKPSYTIPARYYKDGYDALVHYEQDDKKTRRLMPIELARIQTFPDDYQFKGTRKDIIMQIGNAVPCTLAYHIANHLRVTCFTWNQRALLA